MLQKRQRYKIDGVYKPGKELYIADTLSCAYQQADESDYNEYEVMNIEVLYNTRLDELKNETKNYNTSRCLETIDVCIWRMFVFMSSVVVTVWGSVGMFVV